MFKGLQAKSKKRLILYNVQLTNITRHEWGKHSMSLFNDYVKAVYAKLNATSRLTGIVSESLNDTNSFPKIWLEDGGADDWSNKDDDA